MAKRSSGPSDHPELLFFPVYVAEWCVTGLVGALVKPEVAGEAGLQLTLGPAQGAGVWHRAGTHLSRGWAGSGPGRLAFSSAACSRCHGGLREGRDEDPWIPRAPPPSLGQGRAEGSISPPRGKGRGDTPELFSSPRTSGMPRFRFLSTP